ncbi:metal-sensitive transcriptional regulator [Alkalispirochaeta americana]|nr:metal-sensitive transcriptional regulator [Alkalispirochaeta americana]
MMSEEQKKNVRERLNRIAGQVGGVQRMVEDGRYCMDILAQTRSVIAALRAVEDLIMENHLKTCVTQAIKNDDTEDQREKVEELMQILAQFRKYG